MQQLRVLPGVEAACESLRAAGLLLICVSNQPDIARGATTTKVVEAMNDELRRRLSLDLVVICPHDGVDGCDCRKPQPGLLLRGARELAVDLRQSVMVGDRWRDIEAGRRAGCSTVFVDHGYEEGRTVAADLTVSCLTEAVPWILDLTSRCGSTSDKS